MRPSLCDSLSLLSNEKTSLNCLMPYLCKYIRELTRFYCLIESSFHDTHSAHRCKPCRQHWPSSYSSVYFLLLEYVCVYVLRLNIVTNLSRHLLTVFCFYIHLLLGAVAL